MTKSSRITSGRVALATSTAWSPSSAWPTTSTSGWNERMAMMPSRTTFWSSTTRMRIFFISTAFFLDLFLSFRIFHLGKQSMTDLFKLDRHAPACGLSCGQGQSGKPACVLIRVFQLLFLLFPSFHGPDFDKITQPDQHGVLLQLSKLGQFHGYAELTGIVQFQFTGAAEHQPLQQAGERISDVKGHHSFVNL